MRDSPVVRHILSMEKKGMVFGLDGIRSILEAIGNPQNGYKTLHVGGTNGKGSVTKILSTILTQHGLTTGRYTSPHLHSITERFSINEKDIDYEEFVEISEYIWKKIEEKGLLDSFTFFDFTTALAFEYFKKKSVEIAVIEVGLGGRLDSTNVIFPLVSVITNVSYDHMDYLGKTISSIAREKAGIIKEETPCVTGTKGVALKVIKDVAKQKNAPLYILGRDFSFQRKNEKVMEYKGLRWHLPNLYINLLGDHQFFNTALALCVLEILEEKGFKLEEPKIREGLSKVQWMGRLEVVKERPMIILDGAHNVHGLSALSQYVLKNLSEKKIICIFGVMKDKEFRKMAKEISLWAQEIILTRPSVERALEVPKLKECLPYAHTTDSVKEALIYAKSVADDKDVIIVTGSLFTVAEARSLIDEIF
ncbi:MAG: bifunctional folylpolyglutamate synthase/dihydrofolate synthase [Desulfobacterota bacterium]|nr:bifunctional folylpolyglutamate synthase/dihydrofolate synthase [Thermodesulfobacteriota bacterium]